MHFIWTLSSRQIVDRVVSHTRPQHMLHTLTPSLSHTGCNETHTIDEINEISDIRIPSVEELEQSGRVSLCSSYCCYSNVQLYHSQYNSGIVC